MTSRKLAYMAMLAALCVVLVLLVHFPIFASAPFLEYDPGDVPILIGAFAFGPWAALAVTVVAALAQGLTVSAQSGVYGIVMHILATGAFCVTAGLIYSRKRTRKRAVLALAAGCLCMTAVMAFANLVVTPYFTGWPVSAVKDILFPVIIPFNLIKSAGNSVLAFLVYKTVSRHVFRLDRNAGR